MQVLPTRGKFKYLESMVQENYEITNIMCDVDEIVDEHFHKFISCLCSLTYPFLSLKIKLFDLWSN